MSRETVLRGGLEFVQINAHEYICFRGPAAAYWIARSPHWGNEWQAFTWKDRKPVARNGYRLNLFNELATLDGAT